MTKKLFYSQPDLGEYEAIVLSIALVKKDTLDLVLEASPFYPEGGGQPCDLGSIAGFDIETVFESGENIIHRIKTPETSNWFFIIPGIKVKCIVDMDRRKDHTEQHSAQHLLSAVLYKTLDANTLSFHLGESYSSIDLDINPPDRKTLDSIEDEVLDCIKNGLPVTTHVCSKKDSKKFPLRKDISVDSKKLRIVDIGGYDYSACCGTHVKNIKDLLLFRIIKAEKYKNACRLFFLAGRRALIDYRRLTALARDSAFVLGAAEDSLPDIISKLKEKQKSLERALNSSIEAWAEVKAEALIASSQACNKNEIIKNETASTEEAINLAKAIARLGRTCAISSASEPKIVLASPLSETGEQSIAESELASRAKSMGARGGGKQIFQALFPDRPSLETFIKELG